MTMRKKVTILMALYLIWVSAWDVLMKYGLNRNPSDLFMGGGSHLGFFMTVIPLGFNYYAQPIISHLLDPKSPVHTRDVINLCCVGFAWMPVATPLIEMATRLSSNGALHAVLSPGKVGWFCAFLLIFAFLTLIKIWLWRGWYLELQGSAREA